MPDVFDPIQAGSLTLPNRFLRSATWEGLAAPDGSATPELAERMAELARGQVGLVISGHAFVTPEGRAGLRQLGANDDALLPGLASLAQAVHEAGGLCALQIAHAGDQGNSALSGLEAVGPSDVERPGTLPVRALDREGMERLTRAFVQAALRARKAGFDAVQLHAAHGYLLSQFLSPVWNRRDDAYGGSPAKRARFPLEVARAVRKALGPDFPLLVKLNAGDFVEGGPEPEDMVRAALRFEEAGVDAVELSGGCRQAGEAFMPARKGHIRTQEEEAYHRRAAKHAKERGLKIPLFLVGGIRSFEVAQGLVASGAADGVSLCRPLICEPDLVKRWRGGDLRPAQCVSDNACYGPGFAGEGIRCVTFEKRRARES
ncbi:NADH oxidase [Fundidesulfovibrio magnetotacticus]|uniref:NADH oxidase n=1 Tax=Fundidesulfovibrio magnetotacticus TaxID=2730080 RepID=A0A6V8LKZ7_9BACT|nr:NADH:flavin oxidoreductase [Fundidesulfovibrio magnetotacticus]GFK93372.1 NADH oxidase [Fundidesulfovibrio magnetotacticus]